MNLNDFLAESVFFGIVLSLAAYKIGFEIQRKYKKVFLNPLLISIVINLFIHILLYIFLIDS